jgi:hypothetical protein
MKPENGAENSMQGAMPPENRIAVCRTKTGEILLRAPGCHSRNLSGDNGG